MNDTVCWIFQTDSQDPKREMKLFCYCVWWAILILFPSMTISSCSESSCVTSIKVNPTPVLGSNITITCTIIGSWLTLVNVYRTSTTYFRWTVAACLPSKCSVSEVANREFTSDENHVYIKITNLTRADDSKYWSCEQYGKHQYILLTVYSKNLSTSLYSYLMRWYVIHCTSTVILSDKML